MKTISEILKSLFYTIRNFFCSTYLVKMQGKNNPWHIAYHWITWPKDIVLYEAIDKEKQKLKNETWEDFIVVEIKILK